MIAPHIFNIFKSGSTTYFNASLFFPEKIKKRVFTLYAFVRVIDNYVDQAVQDVDGFNSFVNNYYKALKGNNTNEVLINDFIALQNNCQFEQEWVDAFIESMKADLNPKLYLTMNDTLEYIYGSAEVIGLMMARILELDKQAEVYAKMLGRAMQYANFIRDIKEDLELKRTYFPVTEFKKHGLKSLRQDETIDKSDHFRAFIHDQVAIYFEWQAQAEQGYQYIKRRNLIPIKTAADMYSWTMRKIDHDPFMVYAKKLKPSKAQVIAQAMKNSLQY